MRQDVGKELIPALQKTLSDYLNFAKEKAPQEAKEFSAYQGACKAALLHLALLIKLTQNQSSAPSPEPDLFSLIQQAKKDLNTDDDFSGVPMDLG